MSATASFNADDLMKIGSRKGSNPGGLYQDTTTGTRWYVKRPSNPEQARNEVLSAKLYELAGIEVPDLRLITMDGRPAVASRIIDGLAVGSLAQLAKAADGFAVDAWLANWDVVGLDFDNLLVRDGVPVRVDTGGALRFRARGGLKGSAFGDEVLEIESLRNAGTNAQAAAVFGRLTPAQLGASVARVLAIEPEDIRRLVDEFGPLDCTEREQLLATLMARREDLARRYASVDDHLISRKVERKSTIYTGPIRGQLCQCAACGHTFGGERGFDRHRCGEFAQPGQWQGARRCMTSAEIAASGLAQDEHGVWRLPKPAHFHAASGQSGPSASPPATTPLERAA